LSSEFPSTPDVLVVLGAGLLVSRDGGQSWADWETDRDYDPGIASASAPLGLAPGSPLLVGLVGGDVLRI
jgi:hypothetical protein